GRARRRGEHRFAGQVGADVHCQPVRGLVAALPVPASGTSGGKVARDAQPHDSPCSPSETRRTTSKPPAARPHSISIRRRAHSNVRTAPRIARRTTPGSFTHASTTTANSWCGSPTRSGRCALVVLVSRPAFGPCCPPPVRPLHIGQ